MSCRRAACTRGSAHAGTEHPAASTAAEDPAQSRAYTRDQIQQFSEFLKENVQTKLDKIAYRLRRYVGKGLFESISESA